ncbi:MAG: UDP-galactopyranose mutase [Thermodesulfobacteriota bacterium]
MQYDVLIVGAGITGLTVARQLAEAGKKTLVLDRRAHIGGNCHDEYDEHGILIHRYGPHIFHTNHQAVWEFLSRFTDWRHYQHRVKAYVDSMLVPMPVNVDTLNCLYNLSLTAETMAAYLESVREKLEVVRDSRDAVLARFGADIYEKFFKNYTLKQWGIAAEDLHPSVCERIPIRLNRDDRYFTDRFQGMPLHGYHRLFERLAAHPGIHLLLQADYREVARQVKHKALVYTGPIDEYFDYCHGRLGYRSLRFDFRNHRQDSFQEEAVVNFPNDYAFTRITEYKKMTGQQADSTTVSYEYPCNEGDPYYPIPTADNQQLHARYAGEAKKEKKVAFAGRLGAYRYMNMDVACLDAMQLAMNLLKA